ncbi:transglycosylase SLT domain-containing protein [Thermoleophilia bacterium SCSIO 60948]|nr:transglycosylase SLT domain-containing protein [Thermoleophilia bacterium SCSIO 60948]
MKRTFLLTFALAILGLAVAAGASQAGGGLLGTGVGPVDVNVPGGQNLPEAPVPQCANLADEDGDGLIDLADPDCSSALDNSESGSAGVPTTTVPTNPEVPVDPTNPIPDTSVPPTTTIPPTTTTPTGPEGPTGGGGLGEGPRGSGGTYDAGGDRDQDRDEPEPDIGSDAPREPMDQPDLRRPDGSPTATNPTVTQADFGPASIGVPNFMIDDFSIPPFLLPIYQACGTQYNVPWEVLASINRIETNFGELATVTSYAGAVGWMQFMPATWEAYGVDANGDGKRDPYNPVDAICGAANYLDASGASDDLRSAIFAYNHADWYVDEVILYAEQYGDLPDDLVGSLTGLTENARFPVAADARYADDLSERELMMRASGKVDPNAGSQLIKSSPTRRGINIYSRDNAPVVAVNDGTVTKIGKSKRLGRFIVLTDNYGNRFTYSNLGEIAPAYPVPKERKLKASDFAIDGKKGELPEPEQPASVTREPAEKKSLGGGTRKNIKQPKAAKAKGGGSAAKPGSKRLTNTEDMRDRLFAYPERERNKARADLTGQLDGLMRNRMPGYENFKDYLGGVMRFDQKTMRLEKLRKGSKVTGGTVLGRLTEGADASPYLHFTIRPAGRGAPKIDPKPILDGWKLLEATAIYRAAGKNPFEQSEADTGQILLMSKEQLIKQVTSDPGIEIYSCGVDDIRSGQIDRRILALLAYLSERGLDPTVTSLRCGRSSIYTSSGGISQHSFGGAVDIAQINGISMLGNQGPGTITESTIEEILKLQGPMVPDQVISLMEMGGPTFSLPDHNDHIHVGYAATTESTIGGEPSARESSVLKPDQWDRLIDQLGKIDNPDVLSRPSRFALPAEQGKSKRLKGRASSAHIAE